MRKIRICCCMFLIGILCCIGCGRMVAEEGGAVSTDAMLTGKEESGAEEARETKATEADAGDRDGEKQSAEETDGQKTEEESAGKGNGTTGNAEAKETDDTNNAGALTASGTQPMEGGLLSRLTVSGTQLTDAAGNPVQLKGISTHGLAWYPEYVNEECIRQLKEEWGMNVIRLAMYTAESGGYCTGGNQEDLKTLVRDGVKYATDCGLYVIIDWHILSDGNPNTYLEQAKAFFGEMSEEYAGYDNIFYEICNEPNGGVSWSEVKRYAEEIIPVIRENDGDGIILVGTPNWSQYVDQAAADPITGYENIMYTLHFYAATHTDSLRAAMVSAVEAGLPVFVSEYGICDASGNGAIDINQADKWVEVMDEYGISYVAWNLSNKAETSAILKSSCGKVSGFHREDLSDSGKWLLGMLEKAGAAGGTGDSGSGEAGNGAADSKTGAGSATGAGSGTVGSKAEAGNGSGGRGTGAGTGADAESGGKEPGSGSAGDSSADNGTADRIETGDLEVTAKIVNSWGQGSETCFQYDLTLINAADTEQNGWTIQLTFSSDIALQNGWNGKYEVDGNILTISSMDYNARIDKGGSAGDVGFIIQADADCSLEIY